MYFEDMLYLQNADFLLKLLLDLVRKSSIIELVDDEFTVQKVILGGETV